MCPLDGRVEDHQHVLKRCFFSGFMFDTVRKAFGLVSWEGGSMEPSRLLLAAPLLSMQTTQGLVLWVGLRAQWRLGCEVKYQRQQVSLHDFVALWGAGLESWRGERNMSCNRADLQHLIVQLQAWGESRVMFQRTPGAPTTARKPAAQPGTLQKKELKWGEHKKTLLLELERMGQEGWVVVYMDGSAKCVRGWMQAGYGVWYGLHHTRNFQRMCRPMSVRASAGGSCGSLSEPTIDPPQPPLFDTQPPSVTLQPLPAVGYPPTAVGFPNPQHPPKPPVTGRSGPAPARPPWPGGRGGSHGAQGQQEEGAEVRLRSTGAAYGAQLLPTESRLRGGGGSVSSAGVVAPRECRVRTSATISQTPGNDPKTYPPKQPIELQKT